MPRTRLMRVLALLAAIALTLTAGGTIALTIDSDGNVTVEPKPSQIPAPAAVAVDGPDRDADPDTALELDREAREVYQNATATPERFDLAGDLRGDDSAPVGQHEGPLATPSFPGCRTRILPTNWSNRTAAVRAIGLHYTAGANRTGTPDMDGLTAYASSPIAGVSWHFLIDAEGHCYYSVPLGKKAWTIGNLNSATVNIEVIGTGREQRYPASSAGARKLAQVVQRLGRIYDIPMRLGAVSNCTVTRPGIITHWQGGACSGGHHDIRPYDIVGVVQQIRNAPQPTPDTRRERAACSSLRYHRQRLRAGAKRSDRITNRRGRRVARGRHIAAQREWLQKRGVATSRCR